MCALINNNYKSNKRTLIVLNNLFDYIILMYLNIYTYFLDNII